MATGQTGFDDVMEQDTQRAHRWHEFLRELGGTDNTSPQGDVSGGSDPNATA